MSAPLRVLVVDDSGVYRKIISGLVEQLPGCVLAGAACHGREALALLAREPFDLVLLDVEMPELDGPATLRAIRARDLDLPVVMISGLDERDMSKTIDALEGGALGFLTKPNAGGPAAARAQLRADLTPLIEHLITAEPADLIEPWRPLLAPEAKPEPLTALIDPAPRLLEPAPRLLEPAPLRALDASPPRPLRPRADARPSASAKAPSTQAPSTQAPSTQPLSRATPRRAPPRRFDLLAIGVSTGGPKALADLFSGLSVPLPTPVLIVQHMPAHFTRSLAERLDRLGPMRAREAQEGDLLEPGLALIAPGGRHMEINRRGEVRLSDAPPVKGCRPSVDVLLSSLAHAYDGALLTLILTGMGDDGADGLRALGGAYYGLAQDAASCVVYGMPRAAVEAGLIDEIHPLDHLPARLQELLRSR